MNMLKCCLNPKVILGVAIVAAGLLLFAPNLLSGGLPLLIGLICPVSMLLMMRGMGSAAPTTRRVPSEESSMPVSREARLGLLKAQLRVLGERQTALRQQIEQLEEAEAPPPAPNRVIEQAEEIVQAAAHRP